MQRLQTAQNNQLPEKIRLFYPYRSNYIGLPCGNRMHFIDEGEGEPIVMVHGNPTWSFYYRGLVDKFKSKYRVIVPDHIGSGLSDKPQVYAYTLKQHIDNLENLIETLDLKNITLVVHDWGGPIGLGYAIRNPNNIKNLIITNTAAFSIEKIPLIIKFCTLPIVGESLIRVFNVFSFLGSFIAVKKPMSKALRAAYIYPYDSYRNRIGNARFVQDIPLKSDHPSYQTLLDIEHKLDRLTCPKLILWGAKDFCFTMLFFDRWREMYGDAQYKVLEEAGHYVIEDATDEVAKEIEDFLEQ
jgi:haloalkane dehalogenase